MQKNEIDKLLKYGEKITAEFKEAEQNLPKSVWETYSSFANTNGGTIVFGIKENKREIDPAKKFEIQGIKNARQKQKDFWNTINSDKVSANILVDSDVTICDYDGHELLCITVPQASYKQKPVYINGNPYKGSFKRNHEGDYHCTEEDVKTMIRDQSDSGIDGTLLEGYTIDDIDSDTLKAYRIEYSHRNPDHVWNKDDDITFLRNLGCLASDRNVNQKNKEWLTLAGLLMFGKGLPIRERFDNIRMDYLDQTHLVGDARWSDRLTYDGSWENNLYNFLKRVMPKIVSDIKRPFVLRGTQRDDDTPVHKAVREAMTNMIIHADYHVNGVLKVIKKDNCFEFSNPGNLKLPLAQIYQGGNSKARNPRMQTILRMIGYGDNIGSGFPTILDAWNTEQWRKPDLYDNMDLNQVELKLWTIAMMPEECTEELQEIFGTITYQHLSNEEQITLGTALLEESVTNARLQNIFELHPTDIGKLLFGLVEKKMLVSDSKGRWTSYRINQEYEKTPEQLYISDIEQEKPELNETDKIIYSFIRTNGMITAAQVIEITDITTSQGANTALGRLMKKNMIKKMRNGRHFYYIET